MSLCTAIVKNKQQKGDNLSLGDIDFSENVIGDAACSSLSQMILAMPNVHALRLDANTITDAGVEFLCDVIGLGKTGITAMFLADNQLSSKGLGKLASVLEKTTGNLSIDVSGNALISRQGVDAILKASKEGALEFVHFHIRRRFRPPLSLPRPTRSFIFLIFLFSNNAPQFALLFVTGTTTLPNPQSESPLRPRRWSPRAWPAPNPPNRRKSSRERSQRSPLASPLSPLTLRILTRRAQARVRTATESTSRRYIHHLSMPSGLFKRG